MTIKRHLAANRLIRLIKADRGVAAAEFGLLVPVFALSLLGMLDVGLAINERMSLDRALRSGAQMAMTGVEEIADLESAVMNSSDGLNEDDDPPSAETVDYALSINRSCECAGAAGLCTQRCSGGEPPSLFYDFSATQMIDTILLPPFQIESYLRVQLR